MTLDRSGQVTSSHLRSTSGDVRLDQIMLRSCVKVKIRSDHVRIRSVQVMSGTYQVKVNVRSRSRSRTSQFRYKSDPFGTGQNRSGSGRQVKIMLMSGQVGPEQIRSGDIKIRSFQVNIMSG